MKLVLCVALLLLTGALCQDTSRVRSEKVSDAALSTQDAITKAVDRGSVTRATAVGSKMTSAAGAPSASHMDIHDLEEDMGRRLRSAAATSAVNDGDVGDLRSEKMSDAALGTQDAILKASSTRGSAQQATATGRLAATAATHASIGHWEQHMAGGRRLSVNDPTDPLRAEEAIVKAVNTPSKGSVRYATTVGSQASSEGSLRSFRLDHGTEPSGRRLAKETPRRLLGL